MRCFDCNKWIGIEESELCVACNEWFCPDCATAVEALRIAVCHDCLTDMILGFLNKSDTSSNEAEYNAKSKI